MENLLIKTQVNSIIKTQYPAPKCSINIEGKSIQCLWDSGADISCIREAVALELNLKIHSDTTEFLSANNSISRVKGISSILFNKLPLSFYVVQDLANEFLFGWDSMSKLKAKIDAETMTVSFSLDGEHYFVPLTPPICNSISVNTVMEVKCGSIWIRFKKIALIISY